MRNKKVDKVEIGINAPRPNDEVVWIDSDNLNINIYDESASEWVSVGGSGGSAGVADFVFTYEDNDSTMNIHNHDMYITTTRSEGEDADISLESADDVWITANDGVEITSINDDVTIITGDGDSNWRFQDNGGLRFPDDTVQTTAYEGGGSASFVVPTAFKDNNGDDLITFEITGTGTARIGTPQDDLSLRSARDITLFAGDDGPGNVYIGWGDATYTPDSPNRVATIGDIQLASSGSITFDGVQIIGAGTASGDGLSNSTMELVPDEDLYVNDQYLIIDPTDPNHIHIRGGGTIDESESKLILGGEKNNVYISDSARTVKIHTRLPLVTNTYVNDNLESSTIFITNNASYINIDYTVNVGGTDYLVDSVTNDSPTAGLMSVTASTAVFTAGGNYTFSYESVSANEWEFDTDGTLYGPAMGSVKVAGIYGVNDYPLYIQSPSAVLITSSGSGQFLNSIEPNNQIATIAYPIINSSGLSPITGELTHMGKLLYANSNSDPSSFIIPTNSTVAFPVGTEIKFACSGTDYWNITAEDYGITTVWGEGTNYSEDNMDPFIVPTNATATLLKVEIDRWILSGIGLTD